MSQLFTSPGIIGVRAADLSFIGILNSLGLTTNLKLCVDAGDIDSYDGSAQDWIDRSGNLGADEFHRGSAAGSDANDPTFNGVAGGLSSNEYFGHDGGDFFRYGASNETWMENCHKNNAKFTFLLWMQFGGSGATQNLVVSQGGSDPGFIFAVKTDNTLRFRVFDGGSFDIDVSSTLTITTGTWKLYGVSVDEGASTGLFFEDNTDETFTSTYTTPTTNNAVGRLTIGSTPTGGDPITNNSRIAGVMVWEGVALTTTDVDNIFAKTRGRFGV